MRVEEPREKYLEQLFGLPDADLARVRARMLGTGLETMSTPSYFGAGASSLDRKNQEKNISNNCSVCLMPISRVCARACLGRAWRPCRRRATSAQGHRP